MVRLLFMLFNAYSNKSVGGDEISVRVTTRQLFARLIVNANAKIYYSVIQLRQNKLIV